jgi:hypothetical protein
MGLIDKRTIVQPWKMPPKPDIEDLTDRLDQLMRETEETDKASSKGATQSQVFSVERVRNGYLVTVTGGGKWVAETPEVLLDTIKMALADARLL